MKLFINAPNRILNASNILDKVRLKKERAPIYPCLFLEAGYLANYYYVFTPQDLNCLEIQVKVFMFLYISKFILERISSLCENFIKSDDNRIPGSLELVLLCSTTLSGVCTLL